MKKLAICVISLLVSTSAAAQLASWLPDLTKQQTYVPHLANSTDPSGANSDMRAIAPGATLTVLDVDGPGEITHIWFAMADYENYALKKVVLRMYWDNDKNPSVLSPIGDFFGLGLGLYYTWHSAVLSVAPDRALNSFFPMPFQRHARITITNYGHDPVTALYYNIDYRTYNHPLPKGTLYFHAEYRQAQPNHGWTNEWTNNETQIANCIPNMTGRGNYVILSTVGHGQYVGSTFSVLQNQGSWWGEGDMMYFIDGSTRPAMYGTGSEDAYLGAYGYGSDRNTLSGHPFSYSLYGAPIVGPQMSGSRTSVYRFYLHSPIPFGRSFKATIEHGSANVRSDNFYSVAYWYQAGRQRVPLPALPPVQDLIPQVEPVGGPGNAGRAPFTNLKGRPDAGKPAGWEVRKKSDDGVPSEMGYDICRDYTQPR